MLRSKRMKLAAFFVSSVLNALAVIGVTIAICDPVPLYEQVKDSGEMFDA